MSSNMQRTEKKQLRQRRNAIKEIERILAAMLDTTARFPRHYPRVNKPRPEVLRCVRGRYVMTLDSIRRDFARTDELVAQNLHMTLKVSAERRFFILRFFFRSHLLRLIKDVVANPEPTEIYVFETVRRLGMEIEEIRGVVPLLRDVDVVRSDEGLATEGVEGPRHENGGTDSAYGSENAEALPTPGEQTDGQIEGQSTEAGNEADSADTLVDNSADPVRNLSTATADSGYAADTEGYQPTTTPSRDGSDGGDTIVPWDDTTDDHSMPDHDANLADGLEVEDLDPDSLSTFAEPSSDSTYQHSLNPPSSPSASSATHPGNPPNYTPQDGEICLEVNISARYRIQRGLLDWLAPPYEVHYLPCRQTLTHAGWVVDMWLAYVRQIRGDERVWLEWMGEFEDLHLEN